MISQKWINPYGMNGEPLRTSRFTASTDDIPVEYGVSSDAALLHQYSQLCENLRNQLWSAGGGQRQPDALTVVAYKGRQCIGGAQISVSFPRSAQIMSCERQGFSLRRALPDLDLYNVIYGELSEVMVTPEYQDAGVPEGLLQQLAHEAGKQRIQYLFMLATLPQADRYRKAAKRLGLIFRLRSDIYLPDYESFAGGKPFLTMLDLTVQNAKADDVATTRYYSTSLASQD